MTRNLDRKAYALKYCFDLLGRIGGSLLDLGHAKGLEVFSDLSYGPDDKQRLDIVRRDPRRNPSDADGLPILIYFHGGGWISADKRFYRGVAAAFARRGFLTFNVNYRLAPKYRFPAPLVDAGLAVDWIRHNAARYGGDCAKIVLAGDSAGAQIASCYASAMYDDRREGRLLKQAAMAEPPRGTTIRALLLFYGVYDFATVLNTRFPFIEIYARSYLGIDARDYDQNTGLASPMRQISPDLPPVWLCAGEKDGLFSQSAAYAEALKRQGIACRTLFFSDRYRANHGFLFFRWFRSTREAFASASEFLREYAAIDCDPNGTTKHAKGPISTGR